VQAGGAGFTTEDVAAAWMKRLPAYSIFTAEVVAYRNLLNGMSALQAAGYRNPYRDWIGAQIRADMWGYVNPGSPARAAAMALRDACLSHTTDGVYGEVWAAACIAHAFRASSVEDVITTGLKFIPPDSRLAAAVTDTLHWCAASRGDWEEVWRNIDGKYGHLPAVHVLHNTCVIVMGLMLGAGDFQKSICTGVMGGWDTDCTAATIGSITGAMLGAGGLPPDWTGPLDDRCASALAGVSECRISDLAERTLQCVVR